MRTYDMNLVLDLNRCSQVAHNLNMHKYLKLLSRLSGGLVAGWLTGATAIEVVAQPKPSPPTAAPAAPPAVRYPSYSFFQGLTFSPFPGTIPRPVGNGTVAPPIFPLVEVPTPGLITAKKSDTTPTVKRKKKLVTPEAEQPVRRRRRVIPKNN
jgi:hypothetical protein